MISKNIQGCFLLRKHNMCCVKWKFPSRGVCMLHWPLSVRNPEAVCLQQITAVATEEVFRQMANQLLWMLEGMGLSLYLGIVLLA